MKKDNTQTNQNVLNNRYNGAITFLKKQTTQQSSLFDLPWHFILSTENSDKSKLLQHANLDFILKKKDDKNTQGYCEWWSTKENIMVDINPLYFSQNITKAQQKTWQDFLTITQQTKKNAIQSLWLIIDLPTLLSSQNDKKKTFISMLKSRIRDLQKKVTSEFPVYIIITKIDALKGFIDFFDDLSQKERNQPFGISFTRKQSKSTQALAEHFETEFNIILEKLNQRIITRLHHERNLTRKVNIKDFPLQMESIKKPIAAFMQSLADTITSSYGSTLKGLYFTSVEPSSPTEDRLLQPLSNTFNLKPYISNQHFPAQQDYFVKDLLSQVILPDAANFQAQTSQQKKQPSKKSFLFLSISTATIIVLGFTSIFLHNYLTNSNTIRETEDALVQYQLLNKLNNNFNLKEKVLALNQLEQAYISLDRVPKSSLNKNLSHADIEAEKAYNKSLKKLVSQQLVNIIQQQLSATNTQANILYGALKSYLMLTEANFYNKTYFQQWLNNYWKTNTKLDQNTLQAFEQHLKNFTQLTDISIQPNQKLIESARQKLSQISTAELINIILENNNNQIPLKIKLTDQKSKYPLFQTKKSTITIPGIYTHAAFEHVYDIILPATAKQLEHGDWVTGRQGFVINVDSDMLRQIRQQYITDYINAWEHVINTLKLAPINSYTQDIQVMNRLINPDEPIKNLMKIIYTNTNVSYHNVGTPISKHFAYLDKIIYLFKHNQSINLKTAVAILQNINHSENTAIAAFEFSKGQTLLKTKNNPFTQMQNIAEHAPQPIKNWTNSLLTDSWKLILNDTAITINAAWENSVYLPFKTKLSMQYPFSSQSNKDADVNVVNQLFSKKGDFNTFYYNYLAPFIKEENHQLIPKAFYGASIPLSTQGLKNIAQLKQLSDTLYTEKDPNTLQLEFTLAPEKITGNAKAVDLDLDEQATTFSKSFLSPTQFNWPGQNDQHFASIIFVNDEGAQESITKTGFWSVLKLLSPMDTKFINKDNKTIETHITLGDYSLAYALTSFNGLNPFVPGNLLDLQAVSNILKQTAPNKKET